MEFPTGVSFTCGDGAKERRRLEEKFISLLEAHGFAEVITPVFETYRGDEPIDPSKVYRLADSYSGRGLALRWDFTLQIARFAAPRLSVDPRQRWCYRGSVFRPIREHAGEQRQINQIGAELIGDSSRQSTETMIKTALSLMKAARLDDFLLVVGHVGFVEALKRRLALPQEADSRFMDLLRRKDFSDLEALTEEYRLSPAVAADVRRAMALLEGPRALDAIGRFGDRKTSKEMSSDVSGVLKATGDWRRHVIFDLTEPRGFDYYTGIMFQMVIPSIGREVCRGGRYDNLLGRFGAAAAAVGFAFDLELMLQAKAGAGKRRAGGQNKRS